MNLNKGLLGSHPFFASLESSLLITLVCSLKPLRVEKGSIIYRRHGQANYIYFLMEGKIDFFLEYLRVVYKSMSSGSYFGDYEVIKRIPRKHTIRAKIDSNIHTLSKENYKNIISLDYQDVADKMIKVANEKHRRAKRCLKVVINITRKQLLDKNNIDVMEIRRKENLHETQ